MRDTISLHQMRDTYADCDSRDIGEPQEKVFENPCPKCGKSQDYESKVEDMCLCEEGVVNHHFDGILAMVKPSHLK